MLLTISDLCKTYNGKRTVLNHVHLQMGHGMFGLLGPNGAGKSTLMQIMATLLPPTSGQISYGNLAIGKDDQQIRHLIGYLPQSFGLYQKLTGLEFLRYIAMLKGIHPEKQRPMVMEMLEKVNLTSAAHKKLRTYSGGMKQRIGIAQALLGDPQVIIADEPTAGLDPEERIRFRNLLAELSLSRIVLLSTHIVADIENHCSKLAILDQGNVLFQGLPQELTEAAEGKIWSGEVTEQEWEFGQLSGKCLSYRKKHDGIQIKVEPRMFSSEQPFADAVLIRPSIEDAYLARVGGQADA